MNAATGSGHKHVALGEVRLMCLHSWHMLTWAPTECQVYLDIWQGHLSPLEDAGYLAVAPDFYL